jgi:FkbM family methyltransferase
MAMLTSNLEKFMRQALKSVIHPFRAPVSWALQQGLLPHSSRQVLPWSWGVEPFTIRGDGFSARYYPSAVDTVGQRIFWTGFREWEKDTVPVFLQLLRQSRAFLDIGANCGIYPVLACAVNPQVQVVAVEPVPKIFAALENNIRSNNLGARVKLLKTAVSTAVGIAQFHESEDPTMGSLNVQGYRGKKGKVIEVPTTTLDLIVQGMPVAPDLIKIDVEGFEDQVLSGGDHTLAVVRPTFVIEANPDGPYRKLTEIFSRHNYEFHHLTETGMVKKAAIEPDQSPDSDCRNWVVKPA